MKWWQKVLKKVVLAILKFFSKNWLHLVAAVAVIMGAKKVCAIIVERVNRPIKFVVDPIDEYAIVVYDEENETWNKVKLPDKRKGKDVAFAEKGKSKGEVLVEIKHEKITDVFNNHSM